MLKKLLVPLLILPLIVAACGGEAQASLAEVPVAVADVAPKVEPVVEPVSTETVAGEFTSQCTLVSSALDAPEEYAQLFGVTERDWVYGPETAALTIVEYGDFQ